MLIIDYPYPIIVEDLNKKCFILDTLDELNSFMKDKDVHDYRFGFYPVIKYRTEIIKFIINKDDCAGVNQEDVVKISKKISQLFKPQKPNLSLIPTSKAVLKLNSIPSLIPLDYIKLKVGWRYHDVKLKFKIKSGNNVLKVMLTKIGTYISENKLEHVPFLITKYHNHLKYSSYSDLDIFCNPTNNNNIKWIGTLDSLDEFKKYIIDYGEVKCNQKFLKYYSNKNTKEIERLSIINEKINKLF